MNYGEEIAYWYLRLNGFFPITNFVIHRSSEIEYSADCDLLAIRLPFVYEEIGGKPDDWDEGLSREFGFDRTIGVICEVKTGAYELEDVFRPEYVKYAVGRLGFTARENIPAISEELNKVTLLEIEHGLCIGKLLVANEYKSSSKFVFRSLNSAEDFINDRVRKYPKEKYADRMYFGSELFQHTIHRINREQEQKKMQKALSKHASDAGNG